MLLPTRSDSKKASRGDANTTHARSLSLPVTHEPGHTDLNTTSFNSSTATDATVAGCMRADAHLWRKPLFILTVFHSSLPWSRTSAPFATIRSLSAQKL